MAKKTTIEDLAQMIQSGFETTATKEELADLEEAIREDLKAFATKQELQDSEHRILQAISDLDPVKRSEFDVLQAEMKDLSRRVQALEKKRGVAK